MTLQRVVLAAIGLTVASSACQKLAEDKPADPVVQKVKRQESELTVEEVKNYLDGKTLDVSGAKEKAGAATYTIRKEGITALKIGNGASVNNEPWVHEVTFLYDSGMGEVYAVIADVEHRMVDSRQAFFGFTVKRVVRQ